MFLGTCSKNQKDPSSVVIVCLILCLLIIAFGFQGSRGIWQPDEGYYIGTAVTMYDRGDLLVPYLGNEIFLEKPPLIYWGILAGVHLFGRNEWGARTFNALCYVATALVVGMLGNCLFGRKIDGVIAGLVYATMIIPFAASNYVTPDTPLALWTTVAALLFWKSVEPNAHRVVIWKVLMCAAFGLGFLSKGPAVLVLCAGMLAFLAVRRQFATYLLAPWFFVGAVTFCIVGLSWYIFVAFKVPGAASYFLDNEVWGRMVSSKYNRNPGMMGALIYLPTLVLGSLPWSLVWWRERTQLKAVISDKLWWTNLPNNPSTLFLLTWFFVPLVVLLLASSKLAFYALPLFPAFALATSRLYVSHGSFCAGKAGAEVSTKLITAASIWILLMLGSKFALAYYPTQKDSRALWTSIREYLPEGKYEIVTVDDRTDGLIFYGAEEVENVTIKEKPYPIFAVPEFITMELQEMADGDHYLFLIGSAKHLAEIRDILIGTGVGFKEIKLPYGRWLLICDSLSKNSK